MHRLEPTSPDDLRPVKAFEAMSATQLERVARVVDCYEYEPGETLVTHGATTRDVHFLLRGTLRVDVFASNGRYITYELLEQGEMFGELSAIDAGPRSARVTAETSSTVARMGHGAFLSSLEDNPQMMLAVLRRLSYMARWLASKVYEYHAYTVKGRLYKELLRIAGKTSPTDGDLASRIGSGRENVNRIMAELRVHGVLERQDGQIVLHDRGALEALLRREENG